jgi:hypothetical protein
MVVANIGKRDFSLIISVQTGFGATEWLVIHSYIRLLVMALN